jgi:predicted amidohydrolase
MPTFKLACAQFDCRLADKPYNVRRIQTMLREAAKAGAYLVIFPECALTGYCFGSKVEASTHAESLPGPASEAIAVKCRELGVHAIFGLLERDATGNGFYNACALVGPAGLVASYRKIHLPFLGLDRFALPGDRPFAVHDLGGLRVGMSICYDGGFPESARVLTLLGADLVVLPTNWPTGASSTANFVIQTRALENHIYYAAANRVGDERGFHFIGKSRIVDCSGDILATSDGDSEAVIYAEIEPAKARNKRVVKLAGQYEIDRIADRRPEMYGRITER